MSDESLFREVDEEVRQDQFKKIWARYGNLIIGVALGIVVAVAGFQGWRYWQTKQSEAAGEVFATASNLISEGKPQEAQKLLESITHSGYGELARIKLAGTLANEGKVQEAVKIYDEVAASSSAETAFKDLARVRAGYLLVDTATPDELLKRLGDLDQETGPWRNPVREIIALAAWRTQNYAMADKYANLILADPDAQVGLRQRAQMLMDVLTPVLDKPKTP